MKTLGRFLSRPARQVVARSDRDSSGLINDEQFGVLESGVLWDEARATAAALTRTHDDT